MDNKMIVLRDMKIHFSSTYPLRKKPVIAVSFDGENAMYKVASFNSEKTAQWFLDCLEERLGHNG